ncbi:MAG TPA: hypothetical protein VMW56_10250 [Candidatus Margulisiibacteriota bacterium]|nr:hypothetical protein [Candidatus Margulisiibacteriota bacterium]
MSLLAFQTALGRLVRVPVSNDSTGTSDPFEGLALTDDERAQLAAIADSRGFRFTVGIQRSWCEGRAAKGAGITLSIMPPAERRRLVSEWVNAGGATNSFFASEADAFLDFIARRLPEPSHALTVCRMEQAVYRASDAALTFTPPDLSALNRPEAALRTGRSASLVFFFAEPYLLLDALVRAQPLPALSDQPLPVLFAPGLPGLFRLASCDERALWERLAEPVTVRALSRRRHARSTILALVTAGAAELV